MMREVIDGAEQCATSGGGRTASGLWYSDRATGIENRLAEPAADDPLARHDWAWAAYGLFLISSRGTETVSALPNQRNQVATAGNFSSGHSGEDPGRGAATRRRRSSSLPCARQPQQDAAIFHGRRMRSGSSAFQGRQTPQAYMHLDRPLACCRRRQEPMYAVQHMGTGDLCDVHVARMLFYADDRLRMLFTVSKRRGETDRDLQHLTIAQRTDSSLYECCSL